MRIEYFVVLCVAQLFAMKNMLLMLSRANQLRRY